MRGLGFWNRVVNHAKIREPKAQGKSSRGKSFLSNRDSIVTSSSGETAAVCLIQTDLLTNGGDIIELGDNDPAVEKLSVAGGDVPASAQEKETGSVGGIPSP